MKRDSESPEHYIASVEGWQKETLLALRSLIQELAPEALETIEYGMLGYGELCNLAAQKQHVALYISPKALAEYRKDHPGINCGKSCLRFRPTTDINPKALKTLILRALKLLEQGESGCC